MFQFLEQGEETVNLLVLLPQEREELRGLAIDVIPIPLDRRVPRPRDRLLIPEEEIKTFVYRGGYPLKHSRLYVRRAEHRLEVLRTLAHTLREVIQRYPVPFQYFLDLFSFHRFPLFNQKVKKYRIFFFL